MSESATRTGTDSAARPAPRDVQAELRYIVPQETKPYFHSSAYTGGSPEYFYETEAHTVTVRDMRPLAAELSLDRQGFELHRRPTAVADLRDEASDAAYDAELETTLKELTGADRVVIFDHTRRTAGEGTTAHRPGTREPAARVHVDYTPTSGPRRAGDFMGHEEVRRILAAGGRIVQVNAWRPMAGPVRRWPLALGDASSIRPGELVATEQVFPDRVGEIYLLAYGEGQRWYWAPEIERDELVLIKGWDSLEDGRAQFTPHGAFQLPDQDPDAPPRESLEVRTYLIYEG